MDNVKVLFGNRLREFRRVRSLTQEELAELANVHSTYVSEVERAETNVSLEVIERFAQALSVPIGVLFDFAVDDLEDEKKYVLERISAKLTNKSISDVSKVDRFLDILFE